MVVEQELFGPELSDQDCDVRRVSGAQDLKDLTEVQIGVWGTEKLWITERLTKLIGQNPDYISAYVAYYNGKPVSSAWAEFPAGTDFAGLWGGSTLPEFRRKGFYRALVHIRAQEAFERGFCFLTVDARETSRPILEKLGFRSLGWTREANWTIPHG